MIICAFFSFYDLGCISTAPHGLVTSPGLGAGEIKPFKMRRPRPAHPARGSSEHRYCALVSPDIKEQRAVAHGRSYLKILLIYTYLSLLVVFSYTQQILHYVVFEICRITGLGIILCIYWTNWFTAQIIIYYVMYVLRTWYLFFCF